MRFDGKKTKRKITKWGLNELSSVKTGAQSHAKATILKISANDKRDMLNTAIRDKLGSNDSSLDIWVHDYDDQFVCYWVNGKTYVDGYALLGADVQFAGEPVEVRRSEYYESEDGTKFFKSSEHATDETLSSLLEVGFTYDECAVVKSAIDPTGDIGEQINALAMQFGKTCDTIPSVSKTNTEDTDMSDKTPEQLQKELDDATARVTELETLAKMSDAEKSYMDKMSDEDKKKFMAMDAEGRKKQMGVAKANDESFTDTLGQVIRKSEVGENAFVVMKSQHERLAKMEEDAANREALELVKSLCPTLPGTDEAKATALRKCRTSLSTEEFETLEKALKAGEEAMKGRMVAKAHDAPVGNDDAKKAYDTGIAKVMSDKQISKSAAMSSPEGLKLAKAYQEAIKEESE